MEINSPLHQGEGRLWAIALMLSLLANFSIIGIAGFTMHKSEILRKSQATAIPQLPATDSTVTIFPELTTTNSAPELPDLASPTFARTSPDQAARSPGPTPFIGERDTQAASDRAPSPAAPPLPSQAGIEPRHPRDLETTQSTYQDGQLPQDFIPPDADAQSQTAPAPTIATTPPTDPPTQPQANDPTPTTPPPPEKLLTGPSPVDVPVPQPQPNPTAPQSADEKRTEPITSQNKAATKSIPTKPTTDPAFRGNQRKTAIVGSISRTGRSALDVADSPLGRYQAQISRAVEQEWQRNCVRHRDFITPGFLTVRFFVEPNGNVKTVQFVGKMETGEVQKGFTLNAIRDAEIPPMPATLKKEFGKESLELIFNFYF